MDLNSDETYISNFIATVERSLAKARRKRKKYAIIGGALGLITPFFPPAAAGVLFSGSNAMDYDQAVQEGCP